MIENFDIGERVRDRTTGTIGTVTDKQVDCALLSARGTVARIYAVLFMDKYDGIPVGTACIMYDDQLEKIERHNDNG